MAESSSRRKVSKKRKSNIPLETPVVETRQLTDEEKAISFEKTASDAAKAKYRNVFSQCDILLERGLDFKDLNDEVKDIFERRQWMDLAAMRTGDINVTLVAEFYSVLATYSFAERNNVNSISLRGQTVNFNPDVINSVFGVEEVSEEEDYRAVYRLDDATCYDQTALRAQNVFDKDATWVENRFNYGNCIKDLRAIKRFISYSLYPSGHHTAFGREDACIAWAMVNDVSIDVGKIIFRRVFEFIVTARPGSQMYFPSLINDLCLMAGVKYLPNDRLAVAAEQLIGPTLAKKPAGRISRLLRSRMPPPPPPVSGFSSFPPFSSQTPQQSPFPSSMPPEQFQYFVSNFERINANIAMASEQQRQWCDDLRRGGRRLEQLIVDPTFDNPAYPPYQSDPYTLPQWAAPIPTPSSFHPMPYPFGSQSSGPGVFSTGYQTTSVTTPAWGGGFADFAHLTAGMSSMSIDSSVRVTTDFQTPFSQEMPSSSYHVDLDDAEDED